MADRLEPTFYFDSNGVLTERRWIGGQEVIVHYDDIPDSDITEVDGIPVTTALRTVIDLAPDLEPEDLERMVADCLRRRLFTRDDARRRLSERDMRHRPGGRILWRHLFGEPPSDGGTDA